MMWFTFWVKQVKDPRMMVWKTVLPETLGLAPGE